MMTRTSLLTFFLLLHASYGDLCLEHSLNETCPSTFDPDEFTACCYDESSNTTVVTCCRPSAPVKSVFDVSNTALIIAVAVTGGFLVFTIIILICCFWSKCPLYMMCRIRYRREDIIAYASKEEMETLNGMPPEEKNGVKTYALNTVKVTMKEVD